MEIRTGGRSGTITTAQQEKQTFSCLLNTHRITMITLAREAGLPRTVLHAMLMGKPVFIDQAHAVLTGLSRLTGVTYTLQNVHIVLESLGDTTILREVVWQHPTQPRRVTKQPERVVQNKKRSIKDSLFGFLLGGGLQWKGNY